MGSPVPDTIAAIASGVGGGIGIVRLSGPLAEPIIAALVRPWPKRAQSHRLYYGWVHEPGDGTTRRIDEVLACVMRAPRTFTGQDVGEIQGHGGALLLNDVLAAAVRLGARRAEPGEFTRRAFEAGRIDLGRAEAVAELIAARSRRALTVAQALAEGKLGDEVHKQRATLVRALAEIEGALDFPDDADADGAGNTNDAAELIAGLATRLAQTAESYRRFVRDGAEVALIGRTNAGKSSLLNALAGDDRVLVDAEPGTTRDVVEVEVELDGFLARLVDTAGERFAGEAGGVEQRGIEMARRRSARADIAVLVVDGEIGFGAGEAERWEALRGQPRILVWNKRDRAAPHHLPADVHVVETSALAAEGAAPLKAALVELLGGREDEGSIPVVSQRQRDALVTASQDLTRAAETLAQGGPGEVAAVDARRALHQLGLITGDTVDADVLDAIFARFCVGK